MTDEIRTLLNDLSQVAPADKSAFVSVLVVRIIRDIAYYALIAVVSFTLGRRLIYALLQAYRESNRA